MNKINIDKDIAQITKQMKVKDMIAGQLRCASCNSKLRLTIHGTALCPKCLKEMRV